MSAFPKSEYLARLGRVKAAMAEAGIETLCAADPASLNYLTGYDGWSFYVHQFVVVIDDREEPLWVGRAIDAPGAALTTFLAADSIVPYPEIYIDSPERHPAAFLAAELAKRGHGSGRILPFIHFSFSTALPRVARIGRADPHRRRTSRGGL